MTRLHRFNIFMQVGLVTFTAFGFLLTAMKLPQYGLLSNLISQIFWIYGAYQAWRRAGQIGMFVTSVFITFIVAVGVINYWLLGK
jgi:hypothetical protein